MATKKTAVKKEEDILDYAFSDSEIGHPEYIDPADVEHEGLEIKIDRKVYVLPSLTVGQYKRLSPKLAQFVDMKPAEQIEFALYLATAAFKRNYPDTHPNFFEEYVSPQKVLSMLAWLTSGKTIEQLEEERKAAEKKS